jgi:hypothetical protein
VFRGLVLRSRIGVPRRIGALCPNASGCPVKPLPLWWDGELLPDGWWRAWLAWTGGGPNAAPCPVAPSLGEVIALANELVAFGRVYRVVFLTRGDAGRLVELEASDV